MKRTVAIFMSLLFVLAFASCSSKPSSSDQTKAHETVTSFISDVNGEDKATMLTWLSSDLTQTIQTMDPVGELSAQGLFSLLTGIYLGEEYYEVSMQDKETATVDNTVVLTQQVTLKSGDRQEERLIAFVLEEENGWKITSISEVR